MTYRFGPDWAYCNLLNQIMDHGEVVEGRNSIVKRKINASYNFDKFPLLSLRKAPWKTALREWEWFLSGSTTVSDAHPDVQKWWQPWGPEVRYSYGLQFRDAYGSAILDGINQIEKLVEGIKADKYSRRNIICSWHPHDMWLSDLPIANCHTSLALFYYQNGALHYHTVQRSCDVMLGLPANWTQSWAFLVYIAYRVELPVGTMTWNGLDCHVYQDHWETANRIRHLPPLVTPDLIYAPTPGQVDFLADDFVLNKPYVPQTADKLEMKV